MKNLLLLSVLLPTLCFSQNEKMSIGVHLLPGWSKTYSSSHSLWDFRWTYNAGIDYRTQISKGFYGETGISWNEYGIKVISDLYNPYGQYVGKAKSTETYFFLSIPLNLTYKTHGFHISGGPMVSYYVMRKFVVGGQLIAKDQEIIEDKFHFAVNLKTGYEFRINKTWLFSLDAFSNLMLDPKFYNFGLGFSLRYLIKTNN